MDFNTTCINSDGDSINDMRNHPSDTELTYTQFVKEVDNDDELNNLFNQLGYGLDFPIVNDFHVKYFRSEFQGQPCVYMVWSAIEHIFT